MDGLNIHSGGYTEKHNKCHKKYHMVGKFEQILVYMTAYILTIVKVRAFDSQFQNESLSSKLQEELASREEVEHK